MTLVTRIKALTTCIALLIFFEAIYFRTQFFAAIALPISIVFVLAFLWILGPDFFYRRELKAKKTILPFLLILATTFFLFIEPTIVFKQTIIFASVFSIWIFYAIYRKIPIEDTAESKKLPVQNWLNFLLVLTAFLCFWVIYNFYFAYAMPLWISMLLVLLISLILFYYFFWSINIYEKIILPFAALLGLSILEVFLVLAFWSTSPTSRSLILVLTFYILLGLILSRAKNQLNKARIIEYLIVFLIIFLMIIFRLNWDRMI